jgi:hypothetical protein
MSAECLCNEVEQWEQSARSLGLGFAERQLAADPLKSVRDMNGAGVKIQILPFEGQDLATPEPERDGEQVQCLVSLADDSLDERARLV